MAVNFFQKLLKKPTSVFILGCGRSGTSLLASMIIKNYEFTGNNPIPIKNDSNPNGFFEDVDINGLNDKIINESGVALPVKDESVGYGAGWLSKTDNSVVWKASVESIKKIRKLTDRKNFCFKDPRFSYTFPIWREVMTQNVKCVVVFRHPSKSANSMVKEPSAKLINLTYEEALEIWRAMYLNIIKYEGKDFLYVNYEDILMGKLDRIRNFLNIEVDRSLIDIKLSRSQVSQVAEGYNSLYEELLDKAVS